MNVGNVWGAYFAVGMMDTIMYQAPRDFFQSLHKS